MHCRTTHRTVWIWYITGCFKEASGAKQFFFLTLPITTRGGIISCSDKELIHHVRMPWIKWFSVLSVITLLSISKLSYCIFASSPNWKKYSVSKKNKLCLSILVKCLLTQGPFGSGPFLSAELSWMTLEYWSQWWKLEVSTSSGACLSSASELVLKWNHLHLPRPKMWIVNCVYDSECFIESSRVETGPST